MNKFAVFTVLALAAIALAHSASIKDELAEEKETQAALSTSDEEETEAVRQKEGMSVFGDFCIQSRDYVLTDIRANAGRASSQAFSWIFNIGGDVVTSALDTNKDATSRLSQQLANPDAPVEGDDAVANVQRHISQTNMPLGFVAAIQGAMAATAESIMNAVAVKFAFVKDLADRKKAMNFLSNACDQVEEYETKMGQQFESYKQELPEEAKAQVADVKFESVPCVTSRRISRLSGVCGFIKVSFDPIKKAVGY